MLEFDSMQDVLDFAIQLEIAAQQFYAELSARATRPAVVEYFTDLIAEEKLHEQKLRELKESEFMISSDKIKEANIAGYIDAMPNKPNMSYKDAVKLAYDKEKAARMLYSILADLSEDVELKQIFTLLAAQEQGHANYFKEEYDMICLSEN